MNSTKRCIAMIGFGLLLVHGCADSDPTGSPTSGMTGSPTAEVECQPGDPQPTDQCCCDYGEQAAFECVDGEWSCRLWVHSLETCNNGCGPCYSPCAPDPDGVYHEDTHSADTGHERY